MPLVFLEVKPMTHLSLRCPKSPACVPWWLVLILLVEKLALTNFPTRLKASGYLWDWFQLQSEFLSERLFYFGERCRSLLLPQKIFRESQEWAWRKGHKGRQDVWANAELLFCPHKIIVSSHKPQPEEISFSMLWIIQELLKRRSRFTLPVFKENTLIHPERSCTALYILI